jgi:hypothetical protein
MRRLFAKLVVVATVAAASVLVSGPAAAAAGPPRHRTPNLVVLGDSFAAGTGNTPYLPDSNGLDCDRSQYAAYGELLQGLRLATLQGFTACKGATTASVIAQNQLGAITADTDIVTIQVFGNDAQFGTLAGLCLTKDCSLTGSYGSVVTGILADIPNKAAALSPLFADIQDRIDEVGAHARVIVVDYGNPLPTPGSRIGPFCGGLITAGEPEVAQRFADGVNAALRDAAASAHFSYLDAAPRFRGLDICGFATAFLRPPVPGLPQQLPSTSPDEAGILHPNKLGQGIYAAVLAGRLYS